MAAAAAPRARKRSATISAVSNVSELRRHGRARPQIPEVWLAKPKKANKDEFQQQHQPLRPSSPKASSFKGVSKRILTSWSSLTDLPGSSGNKKAKARANPGQGQDQLDWPLSPLAQQYVRRRGGITQDSHDFATLTDDSNVKFLAHRWRDKTSRKVSLRRFFAVLVQTLRYFLGTRLIHYSSSCREAIASVCERRGVDVDGINVYLESSQTPLPLLTTEIGWLGGRLIRIRGN